jgi:dihydroorotate dehydrogenase
MLYEIARPVLFSLDPETAHETTLTGLHLAGRLLPAAKPIAATPVEVMGLQFPNRIGLAAGLDKNGEAIDGLARMGFGFIEIGTITPRRSRATPSRACSGCPRSRASSTGWVSTTTASTP